MTVANVQIRQVLLKRGNTTVTSNYVGPVGELVIDTTLNTIRIQDNFTPGGHFVSSGPQGPQGNIGAQGPQGPQGAASTIAGPQGTQGNVGPQGPQGIQGNVGPQGIQGIQGNVGPQGTQGNVGPQGPQGIQGIQGTQGNTGAQGTGVTLVGNVSTPADLPGTGTAGQGYIVTTIGNLYIWNTLTTTWNNVGPIVGPQGGQGPQGIQGTVGPQGSQGIQGNVGPQGSQGPQGIQGNIGPQGIQGNIGPQGIQGPAGVNGVVDYTLLTTTNANVTAANATITALQANVGSFYTWANTNFGTSSYSNSNVASYLVANPQAGTYSNANVLNYMTSSALISGINANVAGANGNIAAANVVIGGLQANIGSFYTYANIHFADSRYGDSNVESYLGANVGSLWANAGTQSTSIATHDANLGTATTNITALQANLGGYYAWANANVAGLSSQIVGANAAIVTANTALKGYTDNQISTANTAVVNYVNTRTNSLATGANANTAAYLAAGISTNVTTTGNVTSTTVNANTIYLGGNLLTINNATTPVGFRATTPVTNMSVNNGSTVTMLFGTEEVDTKNCYDPATGRFTPNAAGYYSIDWFVVTNANGASEMIASLYKNGVLVAWGTNQTTATAHWNGIGGSAGMIYLNGTTDYISIALTNNSGSTATILAASGLSYFSAYLIR